MDADLQDSPSEIIKLYHSMLKKNNYDILFDGKKRDMIHLFLKIYHPNFSTMWLEIYQKL